MTLYVHCTLSYSTVALILSAAYLYRCVYSGIIGNNSMVALRHDQTNTVYATLPAVRDRGISVFGVYEFV